MSDRKILIVDDDIEVLKILDKIFTTILPGYILLTATSGNAGLNKLKSERPDVVIVDVRLGKESGMDLVKEFYVHSDQKWHRTPRFIVITAYKDKQIMKEALETYKVDRFLIKPFASGEIEEAVLEALEKIAKDEYERGMGAVKDDYEQSMKKISAARGYIKATKERATAHQQMLRERKEKLSGEGSGKGHETV